MRDCRGGIDRHHPSSCRPHTAGSFLTLGGTTLGVAAGVGHVRVLCKGDPRNGETKIDIGQVKVNRKVVGSS